MSQLKSPAKPLILINKKLPSILYLRKCLSEHRRIVTTNIRVRDNEKNLHLHMKILLRSCRCRQRVPCMEWLILMRLSIRCLVWVLVGLVLPRPMELQFVRMVFECWLFSAFCWWWVVGLMMLQVGCFWDFFLIDFRLVLCLMYSLPFDACIFALCG
jgi:hypothetical protein